MKIILVFVIGIFFSTGSEKVNPSPTEDLIELNKEIKLYRLNSNFEALAEAYYNRALINERLPLKRKEVVQDLTASAKYYKLQDNIIGYHQARMELANFYSSEALFLKDAHRLAEDALLFFQINDKTFFEIEAASILGRILLAQFELEKGLDVVSSALDKSLLIKSKGLEIQNRLLLSQLLGSMGKVEDAVEMAGSVIKLEKEMDIYKYSVRAYCDIGYYYYKDGNIEKAIENLSIAEKLPSSGYQVEIEIYETLSQCYEKTDNVEAALSYLKKADDLKDAQKDSEKYAISNQIALEYQAKEKEKEIESLQTENLSKLEELQKRGRLLVALGAFMLVGLLAIYYIVRYYSQRMKTRNLITEQREELDRQRIMKLQNDLRIQSLESMVNGQEHERSRIASDLHDSLGGLLSTLKLQYDTLQLDHEDLTEDKSYQKIYNLIDHACGEVRDIARNLKPASLEKIGLKAAITDLINRYSANGNPEIFFHADNVDNTLTQDQKLHVYRIVQELTNNALKHADATELDIQLSQQKEELFLKVEDNGKGFDEETVKKGLGLENIRSRLNVLKGTVELESSPERGTSVMVHIPLRN